MECNEYLEWDKHYQNEDGDTAFHVAISTDANIDILKALLEKGVDVNVTNNNGKTPFECLNHGSWQTATSLLKLEKEYDLRDDIGDTFFHCLMNRVGDSVWGIRRTDDKNDFGQSEQDEMIEKFWDYILENIEKFAINLNTQNKHGCTPLHIAADYSPSMKNLEMMLSHFEHVNPFITNDTGDNFLHIYFLRFRRMYLTQFQDKMIKGELRYLPKQTLTKLLNSQNNEKNTPLLIHIKLVDGRTVIDIEDILEAGADPNISDWIGDKAIHCILKMYMTKTQDTDEPDETEEDTDEPDKTEEDTDDPDETEEDTDEPDEKEEDTDELDKTEEETQEPDEISDFLEDYTDKAIKCCVKHGADVNATNQRGESPIFLANSQQHIKTLINLGADINLQNKLLQTPLLYFVNKENVNLNTLENLLQEGANVFAADIHGNTVLHYIAWNGYHTHFLPALKQFKIKATLDNLGQLPCDVAYMQGHEAIFDEVCDCKKDTHSEHEHFNLTKEVIMLSALVKTPGEFQETFDCIQNFRGNQMSKVLSLPGIGAVDFEGEAADIKAVAKEIVESICAKLTEKKEFWKCRITQSGSVGENTKVDSPNEFDFVIVLEKLGQICLVDEQRSGKDKGYAYLKLKPEYATEEYKVFFNEENYLNTFKVRAELTEILDELYTTESPFQHPNISFVQGDSNDIINPTVNFSFYWNGCLYKKLLVDIDLVPACQVKGWWPDNCNIDGLHGDTKLLKEQGAVLLLQSELDDYDPVSEYSDPESQSKLRVSAMSAEKEHMLHLPQVARDAYKVCKILCNDRICPHLHLKADIPIKKVVTSYMLKNALFHTMDDMEASQQLNTEPTERKIFKLDKNVELSNTVGNTFLKLLKFTKEENLPSYVFPWQNVFTFNCNIDPYHNHYFCAFRYCFIKVILAMLGEKQDFSDIDEKSCSRAVRDRFENEEIDEDQDDNELEMMGDSEKIERFYFYSLL